MPSDIIMLICLLTGCLEAQTPIGSFSLVERFGVAHPEQPVEFRYTRPGVGRAARLVGPDGQEVPYQQLSNGNILIRTGLPASRLVTTYRVGMDAASDTAIINLNLLGQAQPAPGDVIRFTGAVPAGIVAGVDYFLKRPMDREGIRYPLSTRKDLSDTVNFTGTGEFVGQRPGWIIDGGAGFYARAHGYQTGDPVQVTSTGTLPAPLTPGVLYFAIRASADNFRLAATRADAVAGKAIALQNTGSGLFGTEIRWAWSLLTGAPRATVARPVQATTANGLLQMTNGLTGVRVVTPAANPRPFQRAPIQGVQAVNGVWLANGPNLLYEAYSERPAAGMLNSYDLRVVENGPLLTRLEATYTLNRPQYGSLSGHWITGWNLAQSEMRIAGGNSWGRSTSFSFRAEGGALPCGLEPNRLYWPITQNYDPLRNETAYTFSRNKEGTDKVILTCAATGRVAIMETPNVAGPGSFRETISLYAGSKSVVVESDTDTQLQYFLNLYQAGAFEPNQARFRPHSVSSQACGYSLRNGAKINHVPYTDAFLDLPATAVSGYQCATGMLRHAPSWYLPSSGGDTGWYWNLYRAGSGANAPMMGYFVGRASRLITPLHAGPGIYTSPNHFAANGARAAGITFHVALRAPNTMSTQRTRREWMIYAGTVGELRDPAATQPVALERNGLAYINLTRLATYRLEYADPPQGWPTPFSDRSTYQQMVNRVRTDSAYRLNLYNVAPEVRDLLPFWQENTPAAVELLVSHMEQFAFNWQQIMVNRDGGYDAWWHYYQPAIVWQPFASRVLAVLNSSAATAAQKTRVKAVAAFVASVLWDNDNVPWDLDSGEGAGTANQGVQYAMYRAQSIFMLGGANAGLSGSSAQARNYTEQSLGYLHPESGAPRGSTHYHGAAMDPALANFLLMKANGVNINQYPVWRNYSRWMLDGLTPPEPRFGNVRKMVSSGDGNTAASAMPGMVATLFRGVDDLLSANLQWGWQSQNSAQVKTYGQFSVPATLVIDETAPATPANLRSAHYAGYWSVLRHGFGTPNETAAWFTNGDFYTDHRHVDNGQLSIYAHAAPLAIDWNANVYNPNVPGALQHNRVVFENDIGLRWNADSLPLNGGGNAFRLTTATNFVEQEFATDSEATFAAPDGTLWQRNVAMVAPDPRYPALWIRDQFQGPRAAEAKVLTWNLMAQGAVNAPGGTYPPVERLTTGGSTNVLPSSGLVLNLAAGPQRFGFRGQTWAAHPTRGIDWDLYLAPDGTQSFYIGNWGHDAHSNREVGEYRQANGQPFREQQHILRVRGTGTFTTLLLPYRKGEAPAQRTVTQEACGLRVVQTGSSLCVGDAGYQFNSASRQVVASFGAAAVSALGVTVAGGPVEVVMTGSAVKLNVSGGAGARTVTLPGTWGEVSGWTKTGSVYRLNFAGGRALTAEGRR